MTEQSKVGDVRDYAGIRFIATEELKTFDGNPRGVVWSAGPIALRVDEAWRDTSGHRFASGAIHCRTFEAAAMRAIKHKAAKVRKARELIAEYDAPELADPRAKVDELG